MGKPLTVLAETELPPRRPYNSMILVDICENVHIHHREVRTEFTVPEFREYVDTLVRKRCELEEYLATNPEYEEGAYGDTVWKVGGGPHVIDASPEPNRSAYWPDRLLVQLERPGDHEVHVHYRDRRLDLWRDELRVLASALHEAVRALDHWESEHGYTPKPAKSLDGIQREIDRHHVPMPGPGHFRSLVEDS